MCAVVCRTKWLVEAGQEKKTKKGQAKNLHCSRFFETIDNLPRAKHTIKTLYANTHYQQYLLHNDNIQEIMVAQIRVGECFKRLQSLPRHRRFNQTPK